MNTFEEVWENVCALCREEISSVAYNCWINTLSPVKLKGNVAVISAPTNYQKNLTMSHYKDLLERAFSEVFGFTVTLEVVSEENKPVKPIENITESFTFDNFIVGPSNDFAHAAAVAVAKNPGKQYNPLFIYGKPGLGKTHLLNAIKNYVLAKNPGFNIVYTQGEAFANEIIDAIHSGSTPDFREKFRNTDMLFVDDIQFISGKDSTQTEFFNTFNSLHEAGKQIVLTSDRPPKEINALTERLRQRFEMGLLADIKEPDYETRVAIIRQKAEELNFDLSDAVAQCIANQIKTNVRQIEGVLNKLKAYTDLTSEKPSIFSVITVINEIRRDEIDDTITVEKIIDAVSNAYDVTPADICSKKQHMDISNARHIVIYIASQMTGLTLKQIGDKINRNHSTISASLNKMEKDLKKNSRLKANIEDIMKNLKNK